MRWLHHGLVGSSLDGGGVFHARIPQNRCNGLNCRFSVSITDAGEAAANWTLLDGWFYLFSSQMSQSHPKWGESNSMSCAAIPPEMWCAAESLFPVLTHGVYNRWLSTFKNNLPAAC
jgi:hypothetical protein